MTSGPRPLFAPLDPLTAPLHEVADALLPTVHEPLPAPELPEVEDDDEPFAARVRATRTAPSTSSEATIVEEMLGWLNVQPGVHARKVHQSAVTGSGEPDLMICWRGRMVLIEVKTPDKRPTRVQLRRMLTWQEAGALVGWATSMDDLRAIVAHAQEPAYRPDLDTPGA